MSSQTRKRGPNMTRREKLARAATLLPLVSEATLGRMSASSIQPRHAETTHPARAIPRLEPTGGTSASRPACLPPLERLGRLVAAQRLRRMRPRRSRRCATSRSRAPNHSRLPPRLPERSMLGSAPKLHSERVRAAGLTGHPPICRLRLDRVTSHQ